MANLNIYMNMYARQKQNKTKQILFIYPPECKETDKKKEREKEEGEPKK